MSGRSYAPIAARLAQKSRVDEVTGCIIWTGFTVKTGYGRISVAGRQMPTHRAAYIDKYGAVPAGKEVCHHCDVPACINLDHLWLGTHAENMADMARKGRSRPCVLRGEASNTAKLTEEKVIQIRERLDISARQFARIFGVVPNTIDMVRSGRRWTHVERKRAVA